VNKDTSSAQNDERNGRQGKRSSKGKEGGRRIRSKGKEGGRRIRVMRTDRAVVRSLDIHDTLDIAVIHVLVGECR
jgi:hypothetical protein